MSWLTKLEELSVVGVSGYTGMLLHKVLASCRLATRSDSWGCSSSAGSATDDMVFVIVKWWSQMLPVTGPETMVMASVKCIYARIGQFPSFHEVH